MADTRYTYTIKQLADEKQLDPQTVRRLILAGELKAVKWGRSWRIPPAAVEEFETRNTVSEPSQGALSSTSAGQKEAELELEAHERMISRRQDAALRIAECETA